MRFRNHYMPLICSKCSFLLTPRRYLFISLFILNARLNCWTTTQFSVAISKDTICAYVIFVIVLYVCVWCMYVYNTIQYNTIHIDLYSHATSVCMLFLCFLFFSLVICLLLCDHHHPLHCCYTQLFLCVWVSLFLYAFISV